MDQLAQRVHDLDLVRLQVPDEVPAEGVAVQRMLLLEVLRAVLPHHLDARIRERRHLLGADVLRRDDDGHAGADVLAHARIALGDHVGRPRSSCRCRGGDELSRGCELRVTACELAVQLPSADLAEDVADPG